MRVLSREEMYFFDKYTIENLGISGEQLMENAGKGCFGFITKNILKDKEKVLIFAGTGNNGGDGFVIARYLFSNNYPVKVIVTGNPEKMSEETKSNYDKCASLNVDIDVVQSWEEFESLNLDISEYSLVLDAIFGVGLSGEVRGWKADLINKINQLSNQTVAIDIPSGLDSNNATGNPIVKAEYTLTMAAIKQGLLLENGRKHSGVIKVIDIGIPKETFEVKPTKAYLVTDKNVVYPERDIFAHKGTYGKVAIIAGSPGFSGAAIMASKAALRAGAGLVYLLHPEGMENIFENQLLEVITKPIETMNGNINFYSLKDFLKDKTAILIGPGLGVNESSFALIDYLSKNWDKPIVIDADGINTVAKFQMIKKYSNKQVLFTPHLGEFARLTGKTIDEIEKNKIDILKEFCEKNNVNVLLKGSTTIFSNGKDLVFDISGNDGLATGGSGDVLAGIIVSFLAQGLDIKNAAVSASYIMGKTAEKLEKIRYTPSIIPSDIIYNLFTK